MPRRLHRWRPPSAAAACSGRLVRVPLGRPVGRCRGGLSPRRPESRAGARPAPASRGRHVREGTRDAAGPCDVLRCGYRSPGVPRPSAPVGASGRLASRFLPFHTLSTPFEDRRAALCGSSSPHRTGLSGSAIGHLEAAGRVETRAAGPASRERPGRGRPKPPAAGPPCRPDPPGRPPGAPCCAAAGAGLRARSRNSVKNKTGTSRPYPLSNGAGAAPGRGDRCGRPPPRRAR